MSEEKKEELQAEDDVKEEAGKTAESESETQKPTTRNYVIWLLAGAYLVYTGYRLCSSVLAGEEGGGIGFMIAGIFFIVFGAALVFIGGRGLLRVGKEKQEEAQASAARAETGPDRSEPAPDSPEPAKKTSISERANLVRNLGDDVAEEASGEDKEPE
ncbi:MAG: hypothetical protein LUF78_05080 [Clostridiales bacterium]|nr:hypothetical protein [Clostridiales bacterium]